MQNLRAQFLTKNLMEFLNQQLNNSADNLTKCAVPLTNFFTLHNIIHQFVAFAQYVIKNEFQTAQILSKIVVNELKAPIESILDRNQLIFKKSFIKILSQQHKVVFCLCQLDIHILELKLILQSRDEKKTIEKKQLKNIKRAIIKLIPLCRILYEEAQGVKNFSDVLLQIVNKSIASSKKIEYFEFLEKIFLKADISKIVSLIEQRKNALRQSIITNTKPKIQITQQKNEIDKEEVAKIKLKLKNKSIKKPSSVQKKIEKKQQQILANIPVNNTQNLQQDSEKKQVKIRKSIKIVPRTLHNRRKSIHKQIPEELKIKKQNTKQYKQVLDNNHNFRSSYPICINRSESQNYANIDNILGLGTPKKNQHRESNQ